MESVLPDFLPKDPIMLLSWVNMRLRDDYPQGFETMCQDLDIDSDALKAYLKQAGFEYSALNNKFW